MPRIKKLGVLKKSNNSQLANQWRDSNYTGGSNEHIVLNSLFSSNPATTHQNTHRAKKAVLKEALEPQLHAPNAQEHMRIEEDATGHRRSPIIEFSPRHDAEIVGQVDTIKKDVNRHSLNESTPKFTRSRIE